MSSLFQILSVLLALVASGYSLTCMECVSASTSCSGGTSKSCPPGYKCGALLTETGAGGKTINAYVRSCVPEKDCQKNGSLSIPNGGKVKMVAACCDADNCIPVLPSLPGGSSVSNGLTCRSCISGNSDWCYTPDTMQCTGDENMCLLQTTKISGSQSLSTAIRGCATKSICDIGSQSQSSQGMSVDIKFICTSGSMGLQKGFYLPAVICLFLLKLLI